MHSSRRTSGRLESQVADHNCVPHFTSRPCFSFSFSAVRSFTNFISLYLSLSHRFLLRFLNHSKLFSSFSILRFSLPSTSLSLSLSLSLLLSTSLSLSLSLRLPLFLTLTPLTSLTPSVSAAVSRPPRFPCWRHIAHGTTSQLLIYSITTPPALATSPRVFQPLPSCRPLFLV